MSEIPTDTAAAFNEAARQVTAITNAVEFLGRTESYSVTVRINPNDIRINVPGQVPRAVDETMRRALTDAATTLIARDALVLLQARLADVIAERDALAQTARRELESWLQGNGR